MAGLVGETHRAIGACFLIYTIARVHVCLSRVFTTSAALRIPEGRFTHFSREWRASRRHAMRRSTTEHHGSKKYTLPWLAAWEARSLLSMDAAAAPRRRPRPPPRCYCSLHAAAIVHRRLFGEASLAVQATSRVRARDVFFLLFKKNRERDHASTSLFSRFSECGLFQRGREPGQGTGGVRMVRMRMRMMISSSASQQVFFFALGACLQEKKKRHKKKKKKPPQEFSRAASERARKIKSSVRRLWRCKRNPCLCLGQSSESTKPQPIPALLWSPKVLLRALEWPIEETHETLNA